MVWSLGLGFGVQGLGCKYWDLGLSFFWVSGSGYIGLRAYWGLRCGV